MNDFSNYLEQKEQIEQLQKDVAKLKKRIVKQVRYP
jgi:hypothetical protein